MRQRLTVLLACACALALLAGAGTLRAETGPEPEPPAETAEEQPAAPMVNLLLVHRLIKRHSRVAWHWQRVMGVRLTRELRDPPADPLQRVDAWERIAAQTWRRAQNPPHKRAWLCIHRFEGAWNDPHPPYYGGLQMDLHFQRTYGGGLLRRKGTANHWSPLEQMWTAERAHRSGRGFYPWPNTARYCGLI
jgi:hypothetical protein